MAAAASPMAAMMPSGRTSTVRGSPTAVGLDHPFRPPNVERTSLSSHSPAAKARYHVGHGVKVDARHADEEMIVYERTVSNHSVDSTGPDLGHANARNG